MSPNLQNNGFLELKFHGILQYLNYYIILKFECILVIIGDGKWRNF